MRDITLEDFQTFLNDDLLRNSGLDLKQTYGLSIPISWDTARLWMHGLGFGFSDVKKDMYYDGHDREDVVQHRVGLIARYFEWADVSQQVPGYDHWCNHFVHFSKADAKRFFALTDTDLEEYAVPSSGEVNGNEDSQQFEFHVDDWDVDRGQFGLLGGTLSLHE